MLNHDTRDKLNNLTRGYMQERKTRQGDYLISEFIADTARSNSLNPLELQELERMCIQDLLKVLKHSAHDYQI